MRIAGTYSRTARKLEKLEHSHAQERRGTPPHSPTVRNSSRPNGAKVERIRRNLYRPPGAIKPDLQGAGHSSARKSGFFVLIGRDRSALV